MKVFGYVKDMIKTMVFGFCSLLFFVIGAEGAGKVRGSQQQLRQAVQLKDGDDKEKKKVTVLGSVKKPGAIPWVKGLTLKKAIDQAGGFGQLANMKKVDVTRNEKVTRYNLSLLKKKGEEVEILPGDSIKVTERWF